MRQLWNLDERCARLTTGQTDNVLQLGEMSILNHPISLIDDQKLDPFDGLGQRIILSNYAAASDLFLNG